jgi:hypothetical protein
MPEHNSSGGIEETLRSQQQENENAQALQNRQNYQRQADEEITRSTRTSLQLDDINKHIAGLKEKISTIRTDAKKELGGSLHFRVLYLLPIMVIPALLFSYYFLNYYTFVSLLDLDIASNEDKGDAFPNLVVLGISVAVVIGAIGIASARRNAIKGKDVKAARNWHRLGFALFGVSLFATFSLQLASSHPGANWYDLANLFAIAAKVLLLLVLEALIVFADDFFFYGLTWLGTMLALIVLRLLLALSRPEERRLNAAIGSSVGQLGNLAGNYEVVNNEPILTPPVPARTRQGFRDVMGDDVIPEPSPPANPAPVDGNPTRTTETERPPTPAQTPPAEEPHQPNPEATIDPDEGMAEENARLRRELEARARRDEEEVRP